jgi:sugar phosphate isomerase/epimerase
MTIYSRRDALNFALYGAAVACFRGNNAARAATSTCTAQRNTLVNGVQLGVNLYSFREMLNMPGDMIDRSISAMKTLGLNQCEVFEPAIQPPAINATQPWAMSASGKPSEASLYGRMPTAAPDAAYQTAVRQWRLSTPMQKIDAIGRRFTEAGISVLSFGMRLKDYMTDEEIDRGFLMAKALGTNLISSSTTLTMAERLVPFSTRHKIFVAMHNHSNLSDANQFATAESLRKALQMSDRFRINLDIGHFVAANGDPIEFIREHSGSISHLHIKDRKRNDGANVPMGQGDTPIRAVLQLLKNERYAIPAHIEYEYAGTSSSVIEVRKCLDYVRNALA